MEPATLAIFVINGLLGVVCYFLKAEHRDLKDRCSRFELELSLVKDKYFKKEDFNDFKKELWARLDRMEDDFKHQIQELKK